MDAQRFHLSREGEAVRGLGKVIHARLYQKGFSMDAGNNTNSNMKAANGTYGGFIGMIKVSIPVIMLIVAVVIMLIA